LVKNTPKSGACRAAGGAKTAKNRGKTGLFQSPATRYPSPSKMFKKNQKKC
jgi:hypothetical protein